MPLPFEEVLEVLVRNPKRMIVYGALIGIGWLANRFVPDDCHQEVSRWQSLYYTTERARDSVQRSKDILLEEFLQQKQQSKHTDSLIYKLGRKADSIFKKQHHVQ